MTWTRDGRSIVYGAGYLWRVRADGGAPPERVELAGRRAASLPPRAAGTVSAFVRSDWEPDIYRLEPGGSPTLLIESTFVGLSPAVLAGRPADRLPSDRAGGTDGDLAGRCRRIESRAPDARPWPCPGIAALVAGRALDRLRLAGRGRPWDIWTIGVDGSGLRQVTHDPADENTPSWSRDGRFIYFRSNRTGRDEVWRVRSRGWDRRAGDARGRLRCPRELSTAGPSTTEGDGDSSVAGSADGGWRRSERSSAASKRMELRRRSAGRLPRGLRRRRTLPFPANASCATGTRRRAGRARRDTRDRLGWPA